MSLVLIGSQAMRYWDKHWAKDRLDAVQDYDFICTSDDFKDLVLKVIATGNKLLEISHVENKSIAKFKNKEGKRVVIEASLIDKEGQLAESDRQIYEFHARAKYFPSYAFHMKFLNYCEAVQIANPEICYVLKESHKFRKDSLHFEKTRGDLIDFEKRLNIYRAMLDTPYLEMLDLREKLTYNNKLPKLNQGKQSFFTDSVPYKYDHDTIHLSVSHLDKPAYRYYMKDGQEVMCDVDKWNALPDIVRLYGVLEESYVLALERSIIPFASNPEKAFKMALQKVCTSITSGWFRQYAWDSYDRVLELYHPSFVQKFEDALQAGKIKDYDKEVAMY